MFHKIISVYPSEDFCLLAHFTDGSARLYDVKPLLTQNKYFADLAVVPTLFSAVQVDVGGYGVSWNDDIDLDANEIWQNGKDVQTPFTGLLSFSDATALWGLNESTLRKAITYGKLKEGVDALKFGKQWVITKEAMLREYGNQI